MNRPEKPSTDDARLLTTLVGENSRALTLGGMASILAAFLFIAELAAIALAIDSVLRTSSSEAALHYLALFMLLALVRIAADGLSSHVLAKAAEAVKLRTRTRLVDALAEISPVDKRRPHAGEIASLITSHVEALGPYLTRYHAARLRAAIVPLFVLAVTACFSWAATIVLMVAGPLIPVFMALIGGKARIASEKQLQEVGSMNGALLDRLQSLTTLKLFDAVPRAAATLLKEGNSIRTRTMTVLRIAFLSSAVLELFSALGVAFVAVYVGFNLLGHVSFGAYGELTLSAGLFVLMIAPEYFRPLRDFAAAYHERAAALAACREIGSLLEGNWIALPQRTKNFEPLRSLQAAQAKLTISGKTIIPAFGLCIERGEHVALIGQSGSGKSMLLALFGRLIAPTEGKILVNNDAETNCDVAWLGQRPAFLQGSLASNLCLYRSEPAQAEFASAIRLANAQRVVEKFSRGYHEIIRENAANVSGGEAQRLAIARLALSHADLILADEPTEHLDDETAQAVIDGMFSLALGRTLIVATHDPRIVKRAGRIIDVATLAGGHNGAAA
ncbi:MAG: thiol reductant ABC exporter subunit CydD [Rhizobiales bacterium]|nr:thiol reductant ABC exporter subunit CydD [Hyphomicrobiales bacterium]